MNIVHVEDFVHPDAGYQVNVLARLQAKQGHQVTIVAGELDKIPTYLTNFFGRDDIQGRDERFRREIGARIIRVPLLGYYSGRAFFHPRVLKVVDDLKPDVVMVHCGDTVTGMVFTLRAARLDYPIVLDLHSLEMASVNRFRHIFHFFYKRLIAPVVMKNRIPFIRVVDSDFIEKHLGIPMSYTTLLSFGTDTGWFRPDPAVRAEFRRQHGIGDDDFVVLYAGKLDAAKGGKFLADCLRDKLASQSGKEIVFVVIGNTDGSDYGDGIEKTFKDSENRVIRLPTQRYLDLAKFYQAADMAVYPKQCSLSFFEAQSCGLPVLFEINEINDQRTGRGSCASFKPGDAADFRAKLLSLIDLPAADFARMSANARQYIVENFDFVPVARQYTELFAKAIEDHRSNRG